MELQGIRIAEVPYDSKSTLTQIGLDSKTLAIKRLKGVDMGPQCNLSHVLHMSTHCSSLMTSA